MFVNWFILLFKARTPEGLHRLPRRLSPLPDAPRGVLPARREPVSRLLPARREAASRSTSTSTRPSGRTAGRCSSASSWRSRIRRSWSASALLSGGARAAATSRAASRSSSRSSPGWSRSSAAASPRGHARPARLLPRLRAQLSAYLFLSPTATRTAARARVRRPARPGSRAAPEGTPLAPGLGCPVEPTTSGRSRVARPSSGCRSRSRTSSGCSLWSIVASVVAFLTWLCALAIGRAPRPVPPVPLALLRYSTHLSASSSCRQPVPGVRRQARARIRSTSSCRRPSARSALVTFFRLLLAIPAILISSGLSARSGSPRSSAGSSALFLGRMPDGPPGPRRVRAALRRPGERVSVPAAPSAIRTPARGPILRLRSASLATLAAAAHSSSGLGHRPLTAAARVRIPYRVTLDNA